MRMLHDTVLIKEYKETGSVIVADQDKDLAVGVVEEVGLGTMATGDAIYLNSQKVNGDLEMGSSWYIIPLSVKKGDKVVFYKAHALKYKDMFICRDKDIFMVED